MSQVNSPWTPEQVTNLNRFQSSGQVHPFTCANRGDGNHDDGEGVLVATVRGWICPYCDYTQDWAHGIMAEWQCADERTVKLDKEQSRHLRNLLGRDEP